MGSSRRSLSTVEQLRPLLFGIILFFVIIPLFSYNLSLVTERWRHPLLFQRRSSPYLYQPLPTCTNISSNQFFDQEYIQDIQKICTNSLNAETSMSKNTVPSIVHFVYVPLRDIPLQQGEVLPNPPVQDDFTYVQYAGVQSIRKRLHPSKIILHYIGHEPRSTWYAHGCQRHFSLHRVLSPLPRMSSALNLYQRRQLTEVLLSLRMLREFGGTVFSDFNTLVLRDPSDIPGMELLLSQVKMVEHVAYAPLSIGAHVMRGTKNGTPFIEYMEKRLLDMYRENHRDLVDRPLEEVLGDLLFEFYDKEEKVMKNIRGGGNRNASGIIIGSWELFEAMTLEHQKHLVIASTTEKVMDFKHIGAIHLERYDFRHASRHHSGITRLQEVQELLVSDEIEPSEHTLFGAMLRSLAGTNKTGIFEERLTGKLYGTTEEEL